MPNGLNTILANIPANGMRIQHYSNPNVSVGGSATGVAGTRDNAAQIRAAFCKTANIRTSPMFAASFNGIGCGPYDFYGSVQAGFCPDPLTGELSPCGVGPYTYQWHWSPFVFFSPALFLSSSLDLHLSAAPAQNYYLRLTVYSSDGRVAVSSIQHFSCFANGNESRATTEVNTTTQALVPFPNPANQYTNILLPGDCEVKNISAIQSFGRTSGSLKFVQTGSNNLTVETNTLGDGMYLLKLLTTKGEFHSKLLIIARH